MVRESPAAAAVALSLCAAEEAVIALSVVIASAVTALLEAIALLEANALSEVTALSGIAALSAVTILSDTGDSWGTGSLSAIVLATGASSDITSRSSAAAAGATGWCRRRLGCAGGRSTCAIRSPMAMAPMPMAMVAIPSPTDGVAR